MEACALSVHWLLKGAAGDEKCQSESRDGLVSGRNTERTLLWLVSDGSLLTHTHILFLLYVDTNIQSGNDTHDTKLENEM